MLEEEEDDDDDDDEDEDEEIVDEPLRIRIEFFNVSSTVIPASALNR
jgi:hypothetical protein